MKKILAIATALVLAGSLQAGAWTGPQMSEYRLYGVGFEGGYSFDKWHNKYDDGDKAHKFNHRQAGMHGFFFGVNYQLDLYQGLSIEPGVNFYWNKGLQEVAMNDIVLGEYYAKDINIAVPLRLKYTYDFNDWFSVEGFAGPMFDLGLKSSIKAPGTDGKEVDYSLYQTEVKDNQNPATFAAINSYYGPRNQFDIKLDVGLGVYLLQSLEIRAGVDFGLMNRKDTNAQFWKIHNNRIFVSLCVRL